MAVVDADYKFIWVDIGGYGRNSDGGIFEASVMGQRCENQTMSVRNNRPLPGEDWPTPYVILGDEAFALKSYMIRPFPYRQSRNDHMKDIFNYRLCRVRRVVENVFGILAKKFRIYSRPLEIYVDTVNIIIMTTCILHNLLSTKTSVDEEYIDLIVQDKEDVLISNTLEHLTNDARRGPNEAFEMRDTFINWFIRNNNIPVN